MLTSRIPQNREKLNPIYTYAHVTPASITDRYIDISKEPLQSNRIYEYIRVYTNNIIRGDVLIIFYIVLYTTILVTSPKKKNYDIDFSVRYTEYYKLKNKNKNKILLFEFVSYKANLNRLTIE